MSSPHVVQTILEQFTRCLNPNVEENSRVPSSGAPDGRALPKTADSGRTSTRPTERVQDGLLGDSFNSRSSKGNKKSQSYDIVTNAKKAALPSPEFLEAKTYKRKLEIFRTRDSPDIERHMDHSGRSRNKVSDDLVEDPNSDSSDDEIINLTRNRFTCGVNMGPIKKSNPVSNITKFFNLGKEGSSYPFGLCFATPVRSSFAEDIANLSDDKLTTDEFLERHGSLSAPDLVDDSLKGSDSITDDGVETVNSTLYFESKYDHVIQTRPPMPLFLCQSIPVTASKTDELTEMIKKRSVENHPSKSRKGRRLIYSTKQSSKTIEPPSPNSVAEIPQVAEI